MKRVGDENYSRSKRSKISENEPAFNFTFNDIPCLQNMTLLTIAINLWENINMKTYVDEYCFNYELFEDYVEESYQKLEEMVFEKLTGLQLPEFLKVKVTNYFRPVGLQLLSDPDSYDIYKNGGSYHWTSRGMLDNVRSLRGLINNVDSNMNKRSRNRRIRGKDLSFLYWLACIYCQEEHIQELWRMLPVHKRKEFGIEETIFDYSDHIIAYWAALRQNKLHILMGKLQEHQNDPLEIYNPYLSIYENMVTLTIYTGNQNALRYFWSKLTKDMIIANIKEWLEYCFYENEIPVYQSYNSFTDNGLFLLTHIETQTEQKEILRVHSADILRSLFFHWPFQRLFLPTITMMMDFLQENVYINIMSLIVEEIKERRTTQFFLSEVWSLSPLKLRMVFIRHLMVDAKAIVRLLRVEDYETASAILNYATTVDKKLIISRMIDEEEFFTLLQSKEFNILTIDTLLSNILHLEKDLNSLKRIVALQHANELTISLLRHGGDFQAVDDLLHWALQSADEIREFKQKHIFPMDIIKSYMLFCVGHEFLLNSFLKWYFETEGEIFQFTEKFRQNIKKISSQIHLNSKTKYCLRK